MFRQPALVSNALLSHGKASRETEAWKFSAQSALLRYQNNVAKGIRK